MPNISLKGIWLLLFNPHKTWVISHNDFSSCNRRGTIPSLKNFAHKFASKNIAVSKSIAEFLDPSAAVVYNCYDDSTFKILERGERIWDFVFLGRLVSQKGCELLIKACSRLKQSFTLNIIGTGPEEANLKNLTTTLHLNESITFTGVLTGEDLASALNRCRTMVVPSLQGEGFGMVVLEGLACGCKIIAAEAGGLKEAIGPFGKMFPMGDQERLSNLLEDSIENKEALPSDSIELEAHLKKHSKSVVSDNYLKFFT